MCFCAVLCWPIHYIKQLLFRVCMLPEDYNADLVLISGCLVFYYGYIRLNLFQSILRKTILIK